MFFLEHVVDIFYRRNAFLIYRYALGKILIRIKRSRAEDTAKKRRAMIESIPSTDMSEIEAPRTMIRSVFDIRTIGITTSIIGKQMKNRWF